MRGVALWPVVGVLCGQLARFRRGVFYPPCMTFTVTVVQADGSIQISEEFRARHGWDEGTELVLVVRDDRVLLIPREEAGATEEVHDLHGSGQSE